MTAPVLLEAWKNQPDSQEQTRKSFQLLGARVDSLLKAVLPSSWATQVSSRTHDGATYTIEANAANVENASASIRLRAEFDPVTKACQLDLFDMPPSLLADVGTTVQKAVLQEAVQSSYHKFKVVTVGMGSFHDASNGFYPEKIYREAGATESPLKQTLREVLRFMPQEPLEQARAIVETMADDPQSFYKLAKLDERDAVQHMLMSDAFRNATADKRAMARPLARLVENIQATPAGEIPTLGQLLIAGTNFKGYADTHDPVQRSLMEEGYKLPKDALKDPKSGPAAPVYDLTR